MLAVDSTGQYGGINVHVRAWVQSDLTYALLIDHFFLSHFILQLPEIYVMMIFEEIHITM